MKNISDFDKYLISDFVVDSMVDKSIEIPADLESDEDYNLSNLQLQAPIWCTRIKGFLLSDIADSKSMQALFIKTMKQQMIKDFRNNRAMSYLYDSIDINTIVAQVSMLSMHSLYKNVEDIYNIDDEIQRQDLNPESVSVSIGLYTYFTILNNEDFEYNQFNDIFIRSWFCYFSKWKVRLMMFKMNGNKWKSSFNGVLLD